MTTRHARPTLELGVALEEHVGILPDILLGLVRHFERDLVQRLSPISLQTLDKREEMPSLPVRETVADQCVLLRDLFLGEWLG